MRGRGYDTFAPVDMQEHVHMVSYQYHIYGKYNSSVTHTKQAMQITTKLIYFE